MKEQHDTAPTITMVDFVSEKHVLVAFSDGKVAMLHSKDLYPFAVEEISRDSGDFEQQE